MRKRPVPNPIVVPRFTKYPSWSNVPFWWQSSVLAKALTQSGRLAAKKGKDVL